MEREERINKLAPSEVPHEVTPPRCLDTNLEFESWPFFHRKVALMVFQLPLKCAENPSYKRKLLWSPHQ